MYADGLLDRNANIDGGLLAAAFQNGDAAMIITGPWNLNPFREAKVPYAIASIPAGSEDGRPFMGVQGYMINAFSKNQLLAQTFLQEFVATDVTMQALYDLNPRTSAWLPVNEKIAGSGLEGDCRGRRRSRPHAQHPRDECGVEVLGRRHAADQHRQVDAHRSIGQRSVAGRSCYRGGTVVDVFRNSAGVRGRCKRPLMQNPPVFSD